MESWNLIINTALLGTDKRVLKKEEIGADLAGAIDVVTASAQNQEEVFLQTAALVYNYRQCGFMPMRKEAVSISRAEEEVRGYVSTLAHHVLYDILVTGSISLLQFWLEHCVRVQKIVQPEAIPILMETATKHRSIRPLAYDCCGKRGAWLIQFNSDWESLDTSSNEQLWLTGTLHQRTKMLAELRIIDREKTIALLRETWTQENAATRTEFVQQLSINAGDDDLPFVEELLKDKSVKVKDEAIKILKKIPGSSIVQLYWGLLKPSVGLKKEKGLLGFNSKMVLDILPIKVVDNFIYGTGIEKMSSEKNVSEADFLVYQLLRSVPPSFFEQHLALGKGELLKLLQQHSKGRELLSALALGAIRFNDIEWLRIIVGIPGWPFYADAISLLPQNEAEVYAAAHLENDAHAAEIVRKVSDLKNEWSLVLTNNILRFTARNPYQYNRGFYNQIIHLLPTSTISELDKCSPNEGHLKTMWANLSAFIAELLTLKLRVLKSFDD
jgi:hypothetical protein